MKKFVVRLVIGALSETWIDKSQKDYTESLDDAAFFDTLWEAHQALNAFIHKPWLLGCEITTVAVKP